MFVLYGSRVFSDFRYSQLLKACQQHCPDINSFNASYIYFLNCTDLKDSAKSNLRSLLDASESQPAEYDFVVIPRMGTISPWASRATDLLQNAQIGTIAGIERGIGIQFNAPANSVHTKIEQLKAVFFDRMTETVLHNLSDAAVLFENSTGPDFTEIDIKNNGKEALEQANHRWGLALSADEINYLHESYSALGPSPSDVELMMFAAANSEHCRHKIFNAAWIIDNESMPSTLFNMIRSTHATNPHGVLSAYKDNAAVIEGGQCANWVIDSDSGKYDYQQAVTDIVFKVETHNHPTAIAPFPGAATGSGGEIRDIAATGLGARAKAGLVGFCVSNLGVTDFHRTWEKSAGKPSNIASALDIMLQAPIGAARFNNEFGRPCLLGYFRSFEFCQVHDEKQYWSGYHKPIMLAGGIGNSYRQHAQKMKIPEQALIIVLGGPAMEIGLGGGAASSMNQGQSEAALDFASVQRANPEMQRRCQEVIDCCRNLSSNPILSIHDVGAGGLANAVPEIIEADKLGGSFELRKVPQADASMSPLALWCNESQERYVLAILPESIDKFTAIANRERCPFAVIGTATAEPELKIHDAAHQNFPVNIPMALLFSNVPNKTLSDKRDKNHNASFDTTHIRLADAAKRVLSHPTVASKKFLITIADRSVGGLTARDQLIGPRQVPVADCAVTAASYQNFHGEAMSVGERPPVALLDAPASGRLAVGEAITNILAADVQQLQDIHFSANWMAAANVEHEGAKLYDTVQAVAVELCQQLKINIPVGKDSLSMRSEWHENGEKKTMTSPLSVVMSAAAPVGDIRKTLTPLCENNLATTLLLIDLGKGKNRLGASILTFVYESLGKTPADLDCAMTLKQFFSAISRLKAANKIKAYHDRSDGGLFATLCEMAFATGQGLDCNIDSVGRDPIASLFCEELGAVIQVADDDLEMVFNTLSEFSLAEHTYKIATLNNNQQFTITSNQQCLYQESLSTLEEYWSETSYQIQALRDNPATAQQEFASTSNLKPGLFAKLSFSLDDAVTAPSFNLSKPKVAIIREQGVNGQKEMAAAFAQAGFDTYDIHMSDLLTQTKALSDFQGLVLCGGFSYGDVLGAGRGWASSILYHDHLRQQFADFFHETSRFSLGVCNGCQTLSQLHALIPGASNWPRFVENTSSQFESRLVMTEVMPTNSIFLTDMVGSMLPTLVAHGEGRAEWQAGQTPENVCLRYVDADGTPTMQYPHNPNGSPDGATAFSNDDGRIMIMMPHPERLFRRVQHSWCPSDWPEHGPWLHMFQNAKRFLTDY